MLNPAHTELLDTARKRFARAITAEADNRRLGLDDLRFKNGDQWPANIRAERENGPDPKPCLTVNKFPTFIHQVTNALRQNRPAIDVGPVGDKGDVEVAKMLRGMIRHIQRNGDADIAIDTAVDGAASNGWGYWRLATDYEDADSFDQVLCWKRIRNPFTVYVDDAHQDPTTSDKRWCFVSEMMDQAEFKRAYPKADPVNFDQGSIGDDMRAWIDGEKIRIAEYWLIETTAAELVALQDGFIGFKSELAPDVLQRIVDDPSWVVKTRKSERNTVKCYKITAHEVLESYDWLGDIIPIIRVTGDETDIEGKVTLSGIIRHAKDPARMNNYWVTKGTEAVALVPNAPYVMEEGQIEGHQQRWKNANRTSYPYLLYKGTNVAGRPAPPPRREQFAGVPAGILAMLENSAQDMMSTTGIRFDASKSERMMDESGVALEHLRNNTDLGAFHYGDNLARALKTTGRIFVQMIPLIWDTKRVATILREDDSEEHVLLDPHQDEAVREVDHTNGKKIRSFNPRLGRYAVSVDIGPNYATKRKEASAGQVELLKVLGPEYAKLIADLVAKNQEWDGADEIARRFAFALPPGMLQPETKDMSPQVQALLGQLQQQVQQMTQERQQLLAALNEKVSDQAIAREKIERDFEAKLHAVAATMEVKMLDHIQERMAAVEQQALAFEQQRAQSDQFDQSHALAQQQTQAQQTAPATQ